MRQPLTASTRRIVKYFSTTALPKVAYRPLPRRSRLSLYRSRRITSRSTYSLGLVGTCISVLMKRLAVYKKKALHGLLVDCTRATVKENCRRQYSPPQLRAEPRRRAARRASPAAKMLVRSSGPAARPPRVPTQLDPNFILRVPYTVILTRDRLCI